MIRKTTEAQRARRGTQRISFEFGSTDFDVIPKICRSPSREAREEMNHRDTEITECSAESSSIPSRIESIGYRLVKDLRFMFEKLCAPLCPLCLCGEPICPKEA